MRFRMWMVAIVALALVACSSSKEQTETDSQTQTGQQAVTEAASDDEAAHEEPQKTVTGHRKGSQHGARHQGAEGPRGHRFKEPAKYAKRWNDPSRDEWQKPQEVMAILGVEEDMTVVDLGTGTGYFVPHLAKTVGPNGKVLALDVEEPMVEYIKKRVLDEGMDQVEARVVPYDDPGLSAESIDRLLTVNTWHHIQDREAYARKLADALVPGGAVAVVDYTRDSPHGPPKDHKLEPEQVVKELEAGGLSAKIVEEDLPRQYIVIGRKAAE
ncbi:MAG: class I SAM-dependent methyltransferase [Myxococcota bacterium]